MKDPLVPLLHRIVADRSPNTRKELAGFCSTVLISRFSKFSGDLINEDIELMVILILLQGDDVEDVITTAKQVRSLQY